MKNKKTFITIILCLLFVITTVVTVSAEESTFSGIVSKTVEASGDGDVKVSIDIAGNPGITAIKLWVSYDKNVMTVKENGIKDTELLAGKIQNTFIEGRFPLSWQDSGMTAANNYQDGTIAEIDFKLNEDFFGTTDVTVTVEFAENFVNGKFGDAPPMQTGVISVTRDKFALKDGVAIANGLKNETLIIASYNGDSMLDCKAYPNTTGNLRITVADVLDTNGATKVKAFLWESLETFAPVCDFIE